MKLQIANYAFGVQLENNPAAEALTELLPMEINMTELNGNEKYHYLSTNLPASSEKVGKIHAGDIMLFGDDCLVLFYKSFKTNYSYTRIGYIDNTSNLEKAVGRGTVSTTWSL